MKYYRVDCVLDRSLAFTSYVVQYRRWGLWWTLLAFHKQADAFMHLDSLHRSELARRERFWTERINKWRSQ